jgi:serine/threonine protein kinase/Flp pilus assembly protein TadD
MTREPEARSEVTPADQSHSWIGLRVRSYEVLSRIGAGGMGEVYRAKDTKLGREVALKVLPEEFARDPGRLKRFEQEARSASALNHPNIITVYDIDEHDSTPYIAMEYVEGQTLREILIGGPIPTKKLIHLATQMAEGLAKAHSAGIVHRDLKPENVMVTGDGFVKLLDFGLAKLTHEALADGSEETTMTRELTREGVIVGTLGYMSPEQASGRAVDHRSDQFSFGTVLYEMATGETAFKRGTAAETLAAIIEGEPRPIARVNPKVPAPLRVIVERCLSKEASERYESTRDLAKELERFREIRLEPSSILRRRTALAGIAALAALGLAALLGLNVGGLRDRLLGEAAPSRIDSLAVLPLVNLSNDPEQEYFVDGITEMLITDLAKISALKVIAQQSSMRYKDTDKSIAEIAEELGVQAVISGSVLRSGDRVRVTAQLIEAETDQYLWADSFDRELRDILALYSDVARAIAQQVQIAVTPGEETRLARTRRVDPRAYELYVQGRYHFNRRPDGLKKANELFQQAVDVDPSFAQAHAALAYSYSFLSNFYVLPAAEAFSKAKAAALKAQELDETLTDTEKAIVTVRWQFERDWPGVDRALARALEMSPGDPELHIWRALRLSMTGRHDEAVTEIRRSQELDPYASSSWYQVGRLLYHARRYDQAIQELRQMVERHPANPVCRMYLSFSYLQKGMLAEAVEHADEIVELSDRPLQWRTYVYATAGKEDRARKILQDLERKQLSTGWIAAVHLALGDEDSALAWLEKAYEAYDGWLLELHDPIWDPLRDHPRFQDLLRRLNNPYRASRAGETAPDEGTAS